MLGRVVVPIVDVECPKRCPSIAMIPKADWGIGKRVSQLVLKMSGKFIHPGPYK